MGFKWGTLKAEDANKVNRSSALLSFPLWGITNSSCWLPKPVSGWGLAGEEEPSTLQGCQDSQHSEHRQQPTRQPRRVQERFEQTSDWGKPSGAHTPLGSPQKGLLLAPVSLWLSQHPDTSPSAPPGFTPLHCEHPWRRKQLFGEDWKHPSSFWPEHLHFWKRFLFLFKAQSEKLLEKLKISVKEEKERKKENNPSSFPFFLSKSLRTHGGAKSAFPPSSLQAQGREKSHQGPGLPETKVHRDKDKRNPRSQYVIIAVESWKWSVELTLMPHFTTKETKMQADETACWEPQHRVPAAETRAQREPLGCPGCPQTPPHQHPAFTYTPEMTLGNRVHPLPIRGHLTQVGWDSSSCPGKQPWLCSLGPGFQNSLKHQHAPREFPPRTCSLNKKVTDSLRNRRISFSVDFSARRPGPPFKRRETGLEGATICPAAPEVSTGLDSTAFTTLPVPPGHAAAVVLSLYFFHAVFQPAPLIELLLCSWHRGYNTEQVE